MRYNLKIQIFGEIAHEDAVSDLADAAVAEGFFTLDGAQLKTLKMIEEANFLQSSVNMRYSNTDGFFEKIRLACQKHALSYILFVANQGEDTYSQALAWHPGDLGEKKIALVDDRPVFPLKDVEDAANISLEAVRDLVKKTSDLMTTGRIRISENLITSYRDSCEDRHQPAGAF